MWKKMREATRLFFVRRRQMRAEARMWGRGNRIVRGDREMKAGAAVMILLPVMIGLAVLAARLFKPLF